jgi:phosphoribosylglycinamide formyltransferase 2
VNPIGHRQERGDYQESWIPANMTSSLLKQAQTMAKKVTDHLGGAGIFGVEFFVRGKEVFFSELSPRPHDTGLVTMISQNLSEFDLHLRAVLGLPIPEITYFGASASAVVLADREAEQFAVTGVDQALKEKTVEVRLFGKPSTRPYRRMGVALARARNTDQARKVAKRAAAKIKIKYPDER